MNKLQYVLGICTFVVFCILWATYETPFIQAIDKATSNSLYGNKFITWFHYLGETKVIIAVTIIILIIIWIGQKDYKLMAFIIFTVGGGYGLYQILKRIIERPRPDIVDQFSTYSFPSGHAVHGLLFLFTIAYVINHIFTSKGASFTIWITAILLTLLIGMSRIAEARHFASDVIAGWALGYSWFVLWLWWYKKAKRNFVQSRSNNTET